MAVTTIVSNGKGPCVHCLGIYVDCDTRIDVDEYSNGTIAILFGAPIAGSVSLDRATLARLNDVIGRAIYELDMADIADALPADTPAAPGEKEAVIDG